MVNPERFYRPGEKTAKSWENDFSLLAPYIRASTFHTPHNLINAVGGFPKMRGEDGIKSFFGLIQLIQKQKIIGSVFVDGFYQGFDGIALTAE